MNYNSLLITNRAPKKKNFFFDISLKNKLSMRPIQDKYLIQNIKLGSGSCGTVKKAIHKKSKKKYAIKIIKNSYHYEYFEQIKKGLIIHQKIKHKNIIKIYEKFYNDSKLFIVLEYASNGTLKDVLNHSNYGCFTELVCKKYFRELVAAVDYLHTNNIIHRDISLDNILLSSDDTIKLTDFDCSNYLKNSDTNFYGKIQYASPEMIKGIERKKGTEDIWALGVCLCKMAVGFFPFIYSINTIKGEFSIDLEEEKISKELVDLIKKILCIDIDKRYTLKQIKEHPWIK